MSFRLASSVDTQRAPARWSDAKSGFLSSSFTGRRMKPDFGHSSDTQQLAAAERKCCCPQGCWPCSW